MALHGGVISAASEGQGQGCTFTLELPIFEADVVNDILHWQYEGRSILYDNDAFDLRVLVVDDAAMNRKMTIRGIADTVKHIDEAEDGAVAVEKMLATLTTVPYDIVFMDHQMPVMDGPTAAKEMRRLGYKGKIIGLTGNALPEDISSFMRHGADQVLTKPVQQWVIASILRGKFCHS